MTVFAEAIDTMLADANMCVDVLYRAGGAGNGVALRAAWYRPSGLTQFGDARLIAEGERLELRAADVPALSSGDSFEIAGEEWRAVGDPERGADALTWIVTVAQA